MAIPLSQCCFFRQHSIKHRASTAHPDEDDLVDTTCTHKNLLTERCEINRIPATGRSCAPSEGARRLLLPSTSQGFLPQWTFPMGGPFTASRDSCPGADAKFFAGFMAKNFVAGASHHGQMEREGGYVCPRKVHSGKQAAEGGGRREDCCAIRRSFLYTPSGVQGAQVTARQGAARPERSLQAGFSQHRTVATARNRASGISAGNWRVRQQLPVGVGPDDRMPPGQPGAEVERNKRQPETVTVSRNITPVPCIQPYTTF